MLSWGGAARGPRRRSFNVRAQGPEFLLETLVPAVDVEDVAQLGATFCRQTGESQRRAGAKVRAPHDRAGKRATTADDGMIAIYPDIRAQPDQFIHVAEPVLNTFSVTTDTP